MLYLTSFCSAFLAQNFGKDTHFNGLYRRLLYRSLNLALSSLDETGIRYSNGTDLSLLTHYSFDYLFAVKQDRRIDEHYTENARNH